MAARAASALLHDSSSVAQRAVKFFLGQDELEEDEEPDEAAGGPDVQPPSKQEVHKATAKVGARCARCLAPGPCTDPRSPNTRNPESPKPHSSQRSGGPTRPRAWWAHAARAVSPPVPRLPTPCGEVVV